MFSTPSMLADRPLHLMNHDSIDSAVRVKMQPVNLLISLRDPFKETLTRNSAVAEKPRDTSCHWIFR